MPLLVVAIAITGVLFFLREREELIDRESTHTGDHISVHHRNNNPTPPSYSRASSGLPTSSLSASLAPDTSGKCALPLSVVLWRMDRCRAAHRVETRRELALSCGRRQREQTERVCVGLDLRARMWQSIRMNRMGEPRVHRTPHYPAPGRARGHSVPTHSHKPPSLLNPTSWEWRVRFNIWSNPYLHLGLYCHHQYCIKYGIRRGGRWGGVYWAMIVQ